MAVNSRKEPLLDLTLVGPFWEKLFSRPWAQFFPIWTSWTANNIYLYVTMSILPISDALLMTLRLSLNHLTAAPVIATEPCHTTIIVKDVYMYILISS